MLHDKQYSRVVSKWDTMEQAYWTCSLNKRTFVTAHSTATTIVTTGCPFLIRPVFPNSKMSQNSFLHTHSLSYCCDNLPKIWSYLLVHQAPCSDVQYGLGLATIPTSTAHLMLVEQNALADPPVHNAVHVFDIDSHVKMRVVDFVCEKTSVMRFWVALPTCSW